MKILVVEDEPKLAEYLRRALTESNYIVDVAHSGTDGRYLATEGHYDLVLLDVMLPGLDGYAVLQELRRGKHVPVLMLTARDEVEDRVRGLQAGADDYLVKPVALAELEARVRALIRRGLGTPDPVIRLGRLTLDTVGKRAWLDDKALDLNAREWAALAFLTSRVNRIVSKEQLMQALYDWQDDISANAIEKLLSRLRSKLEVAGITIRTVRGLGYYLEKPDDADPQHH